ncbi:HAD family hydrolase [Hazenella coriacea]|uniref:HAD superfamily hydrolase (TIGR01549 family) n=1 Tax=Hazenella coriacea TaxID=1179467 RepID=A0A4R3L5Y9_9BACL|nr:HAD-IA family hydrolase [Hazenella coriacea]TCS94240.1 HAD superfamily hydrolase (TIGR01549 family) [Hazenella coriacea]
MRAIIFDLDGTLFQTEKVAVPAFQQTFNSLQQHQLYDGSIPSETKIQSVFGMTHQEIWENLLPDADEKTREIADQWMLQEELKLFKEGKSECYPGVKETLQQLKKQGWTLMIASNGVGPYVRGALESQGILHWFREVYTAGDYETKSKTDLVRICIEKHGIQVGYMVGDRSSDVEAGKENRLPVIGCRYSGFPQFGESDELADADFVITTFSEILDHVR